VDRLGDLEERLIAADDLPVGNEPEIAQHGHDRAQEL